MKQKTKRLPLAAAFIFAAATLAGGLAQAQEAEKPASEISFNASLTSDYRFRGISQTRLKPALQAGADWAGADGAYVGTWLSTIKWVKDGGGDAPLEWDVYGGKRGEIAAGWTYDVGGLAYFYPSNKLNPSANTFELYGQIGYGFTTLKYSHALTNLFGFADSKNSKYWDLSANPDLGDGFILNLHVGRQDVRNPSTASYTDWKIGVTKDVGFATLSLAYIDTNSKTNIAPNGKDLGKSGAVLTLTKTF